MEDDTSNRKFKTYDEYDKVSQKYFYNLIRGLKYFANIIHPLDLMAMFETTRRGIYGQKDMDKQLDLMKTNGDNANFKHHFLDITQPEFLYYDKLFHHNLLAYVWERMMLFSDGNNAMVNEMPLKDNDEKLKKFFEFLHDYWTHLNLKSDEEDIVEYFNRLYFNVICLEHESDVLNMMRLEFIESTIKDYSKIKGVSHAMNIFKTFFNYVTFLFLQPSAYLAFGKNYILNNLQISEKEFTEMLEFIGCDTVEGYAKRVKEKGYGNYFHGNSLNRAFLVDLEIYNTPIIYTFHKEYGDNYMLYLHKPFKMFINRIKNYLGNDNFGKFIEQYAYNFATKKLNSLGYTVLRGVKFGQKGTSNSGDVDILIYNPNTKNALFFEFKTSREMNEGIYRKKDIDALTKGRKGLVYKGVKQLMKAYNAIDDIEVKIGTKVDKVGFVFVNFERVYLWNIVLREALERNNDDLKLLQFEIMYSFFSLGDYELLIDLSAKSGKDIYDLFYEKNKMTTAVPFDGKASHFGYLNYMGTEKGYNFIEGEMKDFVKWYYSKTGERVPYPFDK